VENAFSSASLLAAQINALNGEKIFMAHSLGNMITSSAINDHNMNVKKYFAINAAVASETFDSSMVNESSVTGNQMLHTDWEGYDSRTWSACWYKLYQDPVLFTNDVRATLTWRDRFGDVTTKTELYNFWSSGDEVFEIDKLAAIWALGTLFGDIRQYSWQKQEFFKGRSSLYGTGWAGWEFSWYGECDEYPWYAPVRLFAYSASEANGASDHRLRQDPVFTHAPNTMYYGIGITPTVRNQILANGIPALSQPVGMTILQTEQNLDMNANPNTFRPNQWPDNGYRIKDVNGNDTNDFRWLHSELQYVAYYFSFKLFDQFVTTGDLK